MPKPFYKKVRAEYWEIFLRLTESNNILIKQCEKYEKVQKAQYENRNELKLENQSLLEQNAELIVRVNELDSELEKQGRKAN